jgi:hypothetical protein
MNKERMNKERVQELLADDDPARMLLRTIGGLLLGIGCVIVYLRRGTGAFEGSDAWGGGALFLALALPAAFLYGTGMFARLRTAPQTWQAVFVIFGVLLIPVALAQGLNWIASGDPAGNSENLFWIFGLTGAAATFAALRGGIRVGLLLAGIAAVVVWMAAWDVLLDDPFAKPGTTRTLLFAIGVLLVLKGYVLMRVRLFDLLQASELLTVGGAAIVLGCSLTTLQLIVGFPILGFGFKSSLGWDVALLVAAVALIMIGAGLGMRGPAYIGGAGLALAAISLGFDLDDASPAGKLFGWPLLILLAGGLAFAASFSRRVQVKLPGSPGGPAREKPLPPPD